MLTAFRLNCRKRIYIGDSMHHRYNGIIQNRITLEKNVMYWILCIKKNQNQRIKNQRKDMLVVVYVLLDYLPGYGQKKSFNKMKWLD